MKSLMSYVLTKKEKAAIVVLLLLILLTGWYVGIYSPIQERIEAADTTDLEDAIAMEQVKSARIKSMQAEIQENKDADAPVVPSYNNFKEELEELNRIHGQSYDFLFTFNEPEVNGTISAEVYRQLFGRRLRCCCGNDEGNLTGTLPQPDLQHQHGQCFCGGCGF